MLCAEPIPASAAPPPVEPWPDYQIIMWQPHTTQQDAILKGLGITAGMVHADRAAPRRIDAGDADPLLRSGLRFYVENMATDFYSAYHRYYPGRTANWRFTEAQERYGINPRDPRALERDPSLSDPEWLDRIRNRIAATVDAYHSDHPLYYNLADEPGVADLAAYWDFDFSASSLRGLRGWLKGSYGSLAALNREWGTRFESWDRVVPASTREAMRRTDGNFSSWADFKAWMDFAFAHAIAEGRTAVHAADPQALAAIEGGQVPGWGGYDYSRLVRAVDVMELYDGGENVAIVHSVSPGTVILTTSFEGGAPEEWRVWRELLRGTRGLILWDEQDGFVRPDGSLGDRGRQAAPYFRELRSGLGALIINSVARTDPIAILYSPASMRTQWMLDWQPKGDAWVRRGSEAEGGGDNTVRSAVSSFVVALSRQGLAPRFVSSDLLERGSLEREADRVLILPHAVALSVAEARAIRHFAAAGGAILADTEPGLFDEHSRRLARPRLADLFGAAQASGKSNASYFEPGAAAATIIGQDGVQPEFRVEGADGAPAPDVETYRFRDGTVEIVGILHREPPSQENDAARRQTRLRLRLREDGFVYDLRSRKSLGRVDRLDLALDPVLPILLAISPKALPVPAISGPYRLRQGGLARFRVGLAGPSGARVEIFHVDVLDPAGTTVPGYSQNIVAAGGRAWARIPLAQDDPPGRWTLRVTDLPSGRTAIAQFVVSPR